MTTSHKKAKEIKIRTYTGSELSVEKGEQSGELLQQKCGWGWAAFAPGMQVILAQVFLINPLIWLCSPTYRQKSRCTVEKSRVSEAGM